MLIASHRHRSKDLELWDELESADLVNGARAQRLPRIDRSVNAIRLFMIGGPAYVGVSWGKDSVVVAHLCYLVNPMIPLINLRCTNRNPDCDAVRDAYLSAHSEQPYSEVVVDYGLLHASNLSNDELDRETDRRWYAAIRECAKPFAGRHILGVRADESGIRRMRCRQWGESSPKGCAPLAWWNQADVFGYLAVNGLPVHPAYAMLGGGRWPRDKLRTAEIGDTHGKGGGRAEWEAEYYGDVLRRLSMQHIA